MNYPDYRSMFFSFALQANNPIASFSMSDDDRVLNLQPDAKYPMLQLDTPTWLPEIHRGTTHKKIYNGSAAIITPVAQDKWKAQDVALDELEPIMEQMIAFLDHKRKQGWGRITRLGAVYPIKRWEHSNHWGWGLPFTIETTLNCSHDPNQETHVQIIEPVWTVGETELYIEIDGVPYSTTWENVSDKKRALNALVDLVNVDTGTSGVKALLYLESIILSRSPAGVLMENDFQVQGHAWQVFQSN